MPVTGHTHTEQGYYQESKTSSLKNQTTMTMTTFINSQHKAAGYTLVEVLIATVILAIGLLGMAGIQVKGMRSTQSSFLRTEATNIANDMAERMLANTIAAQNNIGLKKEDHNQPDTDGSVIKDNQYFIEYNKANKPVGPINSAGYDCTTKTQCLDAVPASACTLTQLAKYDIESWICGTLLANNTRTASISERLPNGAAKIDCIDSDADLDAADRDDDECTAGSTHQITVSWDEESPVTGELVNQSVTINTVP